MATLSGLKKLQKMILDLQDYANEIREKMDERQSWLDEKSDKYKESEAGEQWEHHLYEVGNLLDDIDNLTELELED